ncbi:MAG: helix-turn-helix transcriptional regulator [Verrucomicrobiota bacterium]|nr:helix-turn-helix transcriptional regulator [Verrucomicrobiota bacterium]
MRNSSTPLMQHLRFNRLPHRGANFHVAVTRIPSGETTFLHDHDFYEFFLVNDGHGLHHWNGRHLPLSRGSLALIKPLDRHCYEGTDGTELEFINLAFPATWWESFQSLYEPRFELPASSDSNQPRGHLHLDEAAQQACWESMHRLISQTRPPANALLTVCSTLAHWIQRSLESSKAPDWLRDLLDQMLCPEGLVNPLQYWQQRSGCSPAHLSRTVRKHYGTTLTDLLNRARVEYFCVLVHSHNMKILDAAEAAGFEHQANFYKVFQRIHACSPREWLSRQHSSPTVPR